MLRWLERISLSLAWPFIGLVYLYRWTLGPLLRALNGGWGHCRHQPTCSTYAIRALRMHGVVLGMWLTVVRVAKCHPWGTHGHDPVPDSFAWSKDKGSRKANGRRPPCGKRSV